MTDETKKLWVFDSWHYVEIYATDLADAERQADEFAAETGVDLRLVDNWEDYQQEDAERNEVAT